MTRFCRPRDRIFLVLSGRDREILWGYLAQTDATKLGDKLGIEEQSVHNYLALIEQKLGFDSRAELLRRVFSALLGKRRKS
jgi:DNA-binding CsgD family transcriptional regulator